MSPRVYDEKVGGPLAPKGYNQVSQRQRSPLWSIVFQAHHLT
jgi:hypothetical protein